MLAISTSILTLKACGNKGNFLSVCYNETGVKKKEKKNLCTKPREMEVAEYLKRRISTTFKLHGFSLRRLWLIFIKHSVNFFVVCPYAINNFRKMCKYGMYRLKRFPLNMHTQFRRVIREHLKIWCWREDNKSLCLIVSW